MEHRGYAIEQYRPEHRDGVVETLSPLLLNLSCTRASLPGYLKLGFAPISEKACLSSYRLAGLFRFLVKSKKQYPISDLEIARGDAGHVSVSDMPRPDVMAAIPV